MQSAGKDVPIEGEIPAGSSLRGKSRFMSSAGAGVGGQVEGRVARGALETPGCLLCSLQLTPASSWSLSLWVGGET